MRVRLYVCSCVRVCVRASCARANVRAKQYIVDRQRGQGVAGKQHSSSVPVDMLPGA